MITTGVICDKCGIEIYWNFHRGKVEVIKQVRARGWSIGKQSLCPDCKKKRRIKE